MSAIIVPVVVGVIIALNLPAEEPSKVVLLPDASGKVGKVVVKSTAGEQVLDQAYKTLEVDADGQFQSQNLNAETVNTQYGAVLDALPPRPVSFVINFKLGSATEITEESKVVIQDLLRVVSERPAPELTVIGHTDTVGNEIGNDKLSLQRAETVREILLKTGVNIKMDVAGRGQRELLVATGPNVDEVKNRRVEINLR